MEIHLSASSHKITCPPPSPLQAVHRTSGQVSAAKVCEMGEEDELEGFMVEIDILTEMQHKNVVGLIDAYLMKKQLWVSGVGHVERQSTNS